ncbi:hypothetical protein ACJRO7_031547 [Eucalyptus globulus]|uniref:Glycosyltransferase N-terminal domain-containing protein n=1 Tax=Eucalyptus globulus TaxID=34317 RepID=A0ABD3JK88_EUCGL
MAKLKHVLCIPFPAQGHVTPLLKLSQCIANHGIKVTVVNTESVHAQVMAANQPDDGSNRINFVAFPDGLETDEERKDWTKLLESISRVMPGHLQEFIEKVKQQSKGNEDEQISFVMVDLIAGWALEVAKRMGIKRAGFWAASVSAVALTLHIPKLIEGGVIQWAPQEEVLAHPSVACFFTHCGWNSTMEGLSNGVPLLCRPYFADQRLNRSFICDVWRVGLGVDADENGVITRHEVRTKILAVLGSDEIKANCQRMKEMARKSVSEGGSSLKNLESLIELIKA